MCGFAGLMPLPSSGATFDQSTCQHYLEEMGKAIAYRGPDGYGVHVDRQSGLGFVHRRLAILELSQAGQQPMFCHQQRYVIVFNGEIYNHLDIRSTLLSEGVSVNWRGGSDTETLLAAVNHWGVEKTLPRLVGMFAFAIYDQVLQELWLARDRLGEKPIYWGVLPNDQGWSSHFIFGSDLRAFKELPFWSGKVSREALSLYMRYGHVPGEHCIYQGMHKLKPGGYLKVDCRRLAERPPVFSDVQTYWSLEEVVKRGHRRRVDVATMPDSEAVDLLGTYLSKAVARQMLSDVPLGAFLSGGIDSSSVVALMQAQSRLPVKTFTIGFEEHGYDETDHARAVARHLGTDHTELRISAKHACEIVPRLPFIYDEPFADASQIPTVLLSELTKKQVTVSLSGDGGDEWFCGYYRHVLANQLFSKIQQLPFFIRRGLSGVVRSIRPDVWSEIYGSISHLRASFSGGKYNQQRSSDIQQAHFGEKLYKFVNAMDKASIRDVYHSVRSSLADPGRCLREPYDHGFPFPVHLDQLDDAEKMMFQDGISYLPDDILTKLDRAAMAASLETRVPFLDHELVEWSWQLPLHMKLRNSQSKWIVRQLLYRYVPEAIFERPKMGFSVPIATWLRGELRDWAESLLDKDSMEEQGYFHAEVIHDYWQCHLSGDDQFQHLLWNVLMFQSWLNHEVLAV